ncbi:MAG TPA: thioredoxin domain-containing protein [Chloroflexota bacterium]|nr:thioredoxin domain-containing protein [Chloroflexota bacterium]HUM67285.1 thioredoxin domain-containing protein [Chloroflexota bacterium]
MGKQLSRQQRQTAHAKAARLKWLRVGGVGLLIFMVLTGLIIWRSMAVSTTAGDTAVLAAPLLDGPADAPIKVVEYGDLTCSSCRQWHNMGINEQLRAEFGDQISFEYRLFPVITAASPRWAEAAQCAAEQNAFWLFHNYVYENLEPYPAVNDTRLQEIAAAIGLVQEPFSGCLDSGRYRPFVHEAIQRAQRDGVRGTPTFLINGQQVYPSYQAMFETMRHLLNN